MTPRIDLNAATGLWLRVLIAFLLTLLLAGIANAERGPRSGGTWILTGWNIRKLAQFDRRLAMRDFDTPLTYGLGNRSATEDQVADGYAAEPTLVYRSYTNLVDDIAHDSIAPAITTLLYDPEHWPDTPLREQQHPLVYMKRFAQLAHARGYGVILAPGRDLMGVRGSACGASNGETYDHAYIRCDLPSAAKEANLYVVQAQADERDSAAYVSFVRRAAYEARAANPGVRLVAGLSTATADWTASLSDLRAAATAIEPVVAGYDFTIHSRNERELQTAVQLLRSLENGSAPG